MMERKYVTAKIASDDAGAVSGIAWQFGVADRVGDIIEPDAFKGFDLPLPMLVSHDMSDPVGTWDSATVKADGFHVAGKMLVEDVPGARRARALVRAGAIKGLSIGFAGAKGKARPGGGRIIKSLELMEISLVTVGMHPGARITSSKSIADALRLAEAIHRAAERLRA